MRSEWVSFAMVGEDEMESLEVGREGGVLV
jgi:hypothetical protein